MEDKSPQVTYLFGAGASAMALPTIKALPQRMLQVKNFIDEKYIFEDDDVVEVGNGIQVNKIQAKKQLLEGFQRLIEVCESHSTIDTYAKKLYINSKHCM